MFKADQSPSQASHVGGGPGPFQDPLVLWATVSQQRRHADWGRAGVPRGHSWAAAGPRLPQGTGSTVGVVSLMGSLSEGCKAQPEARALRPASGSHRLGKAALLAQLPAGPRCAGRGKGLIYPSAGSCAWRLRVPGGAPRGTCMRHIHTHTSRPWVQHGHGPEYTQLTHAQGRCIHGCPRGALRYRTAGMCSVHTSWTQASGCTKVGRYRVCLCKHMQAHFPAHSMHNRCPSAWDTELLSVHPGIARMVSTRVP